MNTTLTLYQLNSSSWMYQLSSYYINFYAYDIPQKLQPNLIALARDPIERQWDRMKKLANLRCHIFSTHILISKIDLLFIINLRCHLFATHILISKIDLLFIILLLLFALL